MLGKFVDASVPAKLFHSLVIVITPHRAAHQQRPIKEEYDYDCKDLRHLVANVRSDVLGFQCEHPKHAQDAKDYACVVQQDNKDTAYSRVAALYVGKRILRKLPLPLCRVLSLQNGNEGEEGQIQRTEKDTRA